MDVIEFMGFCLAIASAFIFIMSATINDKGLLFAKLTGARISDEFHITVYSTHNKLKYIKLVKYRLDSTSYSKKLYPVFYYDNGVILITDSQLIKKEPSASNRDERELCTQVICSILKIDDYNLKYAADKKGVYIIIDNNAPIPKDYEKPEEIKSTAADYWWM